MLRLYLSIKIRAVLSEANDKMQVFLYFDTPSTTDNTQAAKPPTKKEENDHGQHRGAFSSFSFLSHRLQDEGQEEICGHAMLIGKNSSAENFHAARQAEAGSRLLTSFFQTTNNQDIILSRLSTSKKTPVFLLKDARVPAERRSCFTPKDACVSTERRLCFSAKTRVFFRAA